MSDYALEAISLSKTFGALRVTDNVTLRLAKGARQALIGPNGAGKSTLVSLLSGGLRPQAGRILLQGEDVTHFPPHRRVKRGLGRTYQISSQFQGLSVLENIFLAVSERHGASGQMFRRAATRHDLIQEVDELLDELGIIDIRDRLIAEVPYGQQRIVEIALALALRPKVLLLDEPAAGITRADAIHILAVLSRLPKDIAILLIDHDMAVVREFAQEITLLASGSVLMSGTTQEVLSSVQARDIYLGGRAIN